MQRKDLALRVLSTAAIMSIVTSIAAPAFADIYYIGNGSIDVVTKEDADGKKYVEVKQGDKTYTDTSDEIVIKDGNNEGNAAQKEENRIEGKKAKVAIPNDERPATQELEAAGSADAAGESQPDPDAGFTLNETEEDSEEGKDPTDNPTENPTDNPTEKPTENPTDDPTEPPKKDVVYEYAPADPDSEQQATKLASTTSADPTAETREATQANAPAAAPTTPTAPAADPPAVGSAGNPTTSVIKVINNWVGEAAKELKIRLSNVNIKVGNSVDKAAMDVSGDGTTKVELDGQNVLDSSNTWRAGLRKQGEGTLIITDETDDTGNKITAPKSDTSASGSLTAKGGGSNGSAGIGGNIAESTKNIIIEGYATVNATGGGNGAGIGGGANGTGEVIIGGKAKVEATGSAEHYGESGCYGAGAAIGDGGTTSSSKTGPVQNGENKFTTDKKGIQDGAEVKMTNVGHIDSNTVTQTRQDGKWVTDGNAEWTPRECDHSKGTYAAEKVEPYCKKTGSQTYRCISCGAVRRTDTLAVKPNHHNYVWVVTVQPTCTEKGCKKDECSICGNVWTSKTLDALGHQFVETTVDPTCTESGYTVQKCTRCHEEEGERTNLVAPLGHEYKNGVCIRCGAPEPQENGGSSSAAPNYTVTGAETYETSVVDGRYIIAVPSEDAALNAVLGDLRAIKAQGADVVVFRTRSRESSLVIDEMLAMGPDATPFVLTHNGGEAQLTINGAAHNELIH